MLVFEKSWSPEALSISMLTKDAFQLSGFSQGLDSAGLEVYVKQLQAQFLQATRLSQASKAAGEEEEEAAEGEDDQVPPPPLFFHTYTRSTFILTICQGSSMQSD